MGRTPSTTMFGQVLTIGTPSSASCRSAGSQLVSRPRSPCHPHEVSPDQVFAQGHLHTERWLYLGQEGPVGVRTVPKPGW